MEFMEKTIMSALILLMECGLDFLRNVLFLKLISDIFRRHRKEQILLLSAVCTSVALVLNLQQVIFMSPNMFILTFFILCVSGWLIVKEETFAVVSVTFFYMVYMRCYEYFIFYIFRLSENSGEVLAASVQMPVFLHVMFFMSARIPEIAGLFLMRIWIRRISIVKNGMLKMFFASLAGYIVLELILSRSVTGENDSFMMNLLLILFGSMTAVLIFLLFDLDLSGKKYRIENERIKRQLLEEKYQSLNEIYGRNAKLYHDLNNHLNLLWQLLDEGKIEEAKTYISDISEPIRHMQKVTWTGEDMIDVVLNSKIEIMQEKSIDYQMNVEFPQNTGISETDICTILSNLLDNAIEAVEKLPRQEIPVKITMRSIKKILFIQIENPCIETEVPENRLPETSKTEKEKHGWGLWNVSDIADKYQGTFQVESENGIFKAVVMLFFLQ